MPRRRHGWDDNKYVEELRKSDIIDHMAFSLVPKESKSKIDKAGKILAKLDFKDPNFVFSLNLADQWRACHAYPINTFRANLTKKISNLSKNVIIAQRLKRMPTIIGKLRRYPDMQLTTMQDIGGIRAVLPTIEDVRQLANDYLHKSRFPHQLVKPYDYIEKPRDEDGYRSLHLVYKYKKNAPPKQYNGLRIELQIRTKLQHIWATAVETMGTFLGQALKSRQGDRDWLDFFAITSSAFAFKEGTNRVPRFQHLTKKETFDAVIKAEKRIEALDKMKGFNVAVNTIVKRSDMSATNSYYNLIILNSLKSTVQIKPYSRKDFKKAITDYAEVEARAVKGEKIEPVLVSAGSLKQIRKAYPNFFLDITDFIKNVESIINTN